MENYNTNFTQQNHKNVWQKKKTQTSIEINKLVTLELTIKMSCSNEYKFHNEKQNM